MEIPENIQRELTMYQELLNRYTALDAQINAIKSEIAGIDSALKNMGEGESVYLAVGPVLVKKDVESVRKELMERKELLEVRMKSLEKSIKGIEAELLKLKEKIEKELGAQGVGA